jgi:hypothetical protein
VTDSIRRPGVHPAAADAAERLGRSIDLERFRLAGGTALAWHLGHRISEDLDFFSFDAGTLAAEPAESLAMALQRVDPTSGSFRIGENTVHGRVGDCRISFFQVEGAWLGPPVRVREGIGLASVAEVAAMKLVAVMTRCAKKDFYDLVAISETGMTLAEMVDGGRRMYAGFDQALGHLRRSLAYFDEAETDPNPITITGQTWPAVKRSIEVLARGLDRA